MQNYTPLTVMHSKSKPGVKFQHCSRLFSELKVVMSQPFIDISHQKCGLRTDFDLLECGTSPKPHPEVDWRRCDRRLEKSVGYDVTLLWWSDLDKIWFADAKIMPLTTVSPKSKSDVKFQYDSRLCSETGSSNISAMD